MIRRPPTSTRTTPPFPTRRSSDLQQFLPGIGTLVERSGASTLPAYIDGAFEAMPRWAKVPRLHPITVRFGAAQPAEVLRGGSDRSEEHTSELQSLMRISYAVFCLNKKKTLQQNRI